VAASKNQRTGVKQVQLAGVEVIEAPRIAFHASFLLAERYNQYGPYYCCGPSKRWPTPWRVYVQEKPIK
jgi:hypothetical protein